MKAPDERPKYPTKARVRQYVEIARELGMDVAAVEVSRDGTISVMEARAEFEAPLSGFDRYKDKL